MNGGLALQREEFAIQLGEVFSLHGILLAQPMIHIDLWQKEKNAHWTTLQTPTWGIAMPARQTLV